MPAYDRLVALPPAGQPYIAGNTGVFTMLLQFARQRCGLLGAGIGLVIFKMSLHAGNDLLGHGFDVPLWHPAVSAGNILLRAGNFDYTRNLAAERSIALVPDKRIAQVSILSMGIIKHANLAWVRKIPTGTGGKQIPFPVPLKIGRRFSVPNFPDTPDCKSGIRHRPEQFFTQIPDMAFRALFSLPIASAPHTFWYICP